MQYLIPLQLPASITSKLGIRQVDTKKEAKIIFRNRFEKVKTKWYKSTKGCKDKKHEHFPVLVIFITLKIAGSRNV